MTTTSSVITTNFDRTFESAFKKKFEIKGIPFSLNTQSLPKFSYGNIITNESLIYLHGSSEEEFIILKEDDYKNYYPSVSNKEDSSTDVEEFIKFLYEHHIIVFIGFSFDDIYFKGCLKNIYKKLQNTDKIALSKPEYIPRFFWICLRLMLKLQIITSTFTPQFCRVTNFKTPILKLFKLYIVKFHYQRIRPEAGH